MIDRNLTAEKTRKFLAYTFYDYVAKSGLDLKSPTLDLSGVAVHNGNSAENKMMRVFDYQAKVVAVVTAINSCWKNENKAILKLRYLDNLTDWQTQQRLSLSASNYRRYKQNALCEFADRVQATAVKFKTVIPELRVIGGVIND